MKVRCESKGSDCRDEELIGLPKTRQCGGEENMKLGNCKVVSGMRVLGNIFREWRAAGFMSNDDDVRVFLFHKKYEADMFTCG